MFADVYSTIHTMWEVCLFSILCAMVGTMFYNKGYSTGQNKGCDDALARTKELAAQEVAKMVDKGLDPGMACEINTHILNIKRALNQLLHILSLIIRPNGHTTNTFFPSM